MSTSVFVGIDVAKAHLDVAVRPSGELQRFAHDADGLEALLEFVSTQGPELIVLEATGGLETTLAAVLAQATLPVVVINPRQARDFAKATGQLAKTDRLDAAILAHFGEAVRPQPRVLKDKSLQELTALVTRRRQLVGMLKAEQTRLHSASPTIHPDIREHIRWLNKRLKDTDGQLRRRIRESDLWRTQDELLQSAPGVGPVLSMTLLTQLPELGSLSARQVAKLAGLAPLNRDSGAFRGARCTWGGRAQIRAALYMATISAIRYNPQIKPFYERLRANGKKPKVAITACMRKLLVILNAMARSQSSWREHCPQHSCC